MPSIRRIIFEPPLSLRLDTDTEEEDLKFIKLRSDTHNENHCEELGISNIASIGDVSDGIMDTLDLDEADANIVQLGVRTASKDCVCHFPKKRCKKGRKIQPRISSDVDYEEGEIVESNDYSEDELQVRGTFEGTFEGTFPNKDYRIFPL